MPRSPREMIAAIKANLPEKTGRTFEGWVKLAQRKGPPSKAARVEWLKAEHALGGVTARLVASEAEGEGESAAYDDENALLDAMYAGARAPLRPIYDAVAGLAARLGADVQPTVCKGYVGFRRARQFAVVQPTPHGRVDLGLALPRATPLSGRLQRATKLGGGDRIHHRLELTSAAEVDREVGRWLKLAYEAALPGRVQAPRRQPVQPRRGRPR